MSSIIEEKYEDFRVDLIKRLFNTQSFFFLSLSTQLLKISDFADKATDEDYLKVSQILDRLIDSDNPTSKLSLLSEIDSFHDFSENLELGFRKLFQSELNPEEIKATIKKLATDLALALADSIHNEQDCSQLFKIFAISATKSEPGNTNIPDSEDSNSNIKEEQPAIETHTQFFHKHEEDEKLVQKTDSFVARKTNPPAYSRDERVTNFRYEADLYFRVADEAIGQLESNKNSRIALENLELASYSLKGLARKLGLELFAKPPELIEEVVKKIILFRLPPVDEICMTIKKAFSLLKITTLINESVEKEFLELCRALMRVSRSLDELKSTREEGNHEHENHSQDRPSLQGWRTGRSKPLKINSLVVQKQNGTDTETNDLPTADFLNS